jgi:hypothetical protein
MAGILAITTWNGIDVVSQVIFELSEIKQRFIRIAPETPSCGRR